MIDETGVGKRKYNIGHKVKTRWVWGCIEGNKIKDSSDIKLVWVESRDAKTLTQLIVDNIKSGESELIKNTGNREIYQNFSVCV